MDSRVMNAAKRYLAMRYYDILEVIGDNKLLVMDYDENCIALVKVKANDKPIDLIDDATMSRSKFEKYINDYLMSHDDLSNVYFRFDSIVLSIMGENRALIRHLVNASFEEE